MSHSLTNTLETLVLQKDLFSFKLYESNCKTDSHSKVQGEDFCESFFLWIVWGIACCAKVASCLHIIQLKSSTLLQEQTFSKHNYVLVGSSISSLFWLVAQKDDLCAIVFETFLLKKSACGQVYCSLRCLWQCYLWYNFTNFKLLKKRLIQKGQSTVVTGSQLSVNCLQRAKKRLVDFNENNRYNGKDLPQICER